MKKWLTWGNSTYSEEDLRTLGWNDEMLKKQHAHGVREGVVVTNNRVGSHDGHGVRKILFDDIVHGKTIKELIEGGQLVDYDSNVHRVSNTNKRDELIDDIEALCLSIEKRQNELSRLVKELKG